MTTKEIKILAGITKNDELYFIEINNKEYFSMTGFTVRPLFLEDAIRQNRESLEDGELWRQAVEAKQTELGLNEWIDYVIEYDGNITMIDTSLFQEEITIDGDEYIFESQSCGQHQENELKKYFIDEKLFTELMKLWEQYHLKVLSKNSTAEDIYNWAKEISQQQDINKLLTEAVNFINGNEEDKNYYPF